MGTVQIDEDRNRRKNAEEKPDKTQLSHSCDLVCADLSPFGVLRIAQAENGIPAGRGIDGVLMSLVWHAPRRSNKKLAKRKQAPRRHRLILCGDRHFQPVERVTERDLAGKARRGIAM